MKDKFWKGKISAVLFTDNAIDIDEEFEEIARLQNEVSRILNSKNIFMRIFQHKKAKKIHDEAHERLMRLYCPQFFMRTDGSKLPLDKT